MKKILLIIGLAAAIYFIVWTIIFIIFEGFDFTYYWKFFRQSFSSPGEEAAFIRIYAILITCFLLICLFFWIKKG
jgi:ABC-type uncharacterized transport system permease subunit